jgi:hypothetical protein
VSVVSVAFADPEVFGEAVINETPLSENVTVPVGIPELDVP